MTNLSDEPLKDNSHSIDEVIVETKEEDKSDALANDMTSNDDTALAEDMNLSENIPSNADVILNEEVALNEEVTLNEKVDSSECAASDEDLILSQDIALNEDNEVNSAIASNSQAPKLAQSDVVELTTKEQAPQDTNVTVDALDTEEKLSTFVKSDDEWWVMGASAIGGMHVQKDIPCQDNYAIKKVDTARGVAVVCDGAGSKVNSQFGSKLVSEKACDWLSKAVLDNRHDLENKTSIQSLANELYTYLYDELLRYAKESEMPFDTLGCTLIAVIFQPQSLICMHIGDGRAAYQNFDGEWHALMEPWNTEEGYTVFLTTETVRAAPAPREEYIRTTLIPSTVASFVIMSDGCENASFECLILDKKTKKYFKPNRPFPQFFNPVKKTLVQVHNHYNDDHEEAKQIWQKFLEEGTLQLKNETDDKTMVFGINKTQLKSTEN